MANPVADFYQQGVWRCPVAPPRDGNIGNNPYFGYNSYGLLPIGNWENNFGLSGRTDGFSERKPIKESEVAVPADMMVLGESDKFSFMRAEDYDFYHRKLRHGKRADVVFGDGHAESPTLQFLFDDTSDAALIRWNRDHQPHRDRL